jgi:hypothetical protein
MADRVLFISWEDVVHGREERSIEVFNATVGFYGRCQQEGRIERLDVALLMPSGAPDGYMALHGSAEQLAALKEDEEFKRHLVDASMIVNGLKVVDGWVGEGVAAQMSLYIEALGKVPQHAG